MTPLAVGMSAVMTLALLTVTDPENIRKSTETKRNETFFNIDYKQTFIELLNVFFKT